MLFYTVVPFLPHNVPTSANCHLLHESQFHPRAPKSIFLRGRPVDTSGSARAPRMPSARPSSSGFFSPTDGRFQGMGPDTPKWPLCLSGPSPLCASQLPSCSLESRNPVTKVPCRVSQRGSPWAASQAASGRLELRKPALCSGASAEPPCPRGLSYPWMGGGRVFLSLSSFPAWPRGIAGPAKGDEGSLVLLPTGLFNLFWVFFVCFFF